MRDFGLSLRGRVKNFFLPENKSLIPLFEAVVNSLQAIAERQKTCDFLGEISILIDEQEQKNLLIYFVKEINLNPHWEKKSPLKSIEFNFPIYEDSEETVFMCEEKNSVKALFVCPKSNFEESFGYLVSVPFLQTGRN